MDGTVKEQIMDYLAGKLTCKEVTEAVTEYLEGTFTFGNGFDSKCTWVCASGAGIICAR